MLDILNRKNEIDLIYNIIQKYSENKEYISFAINGEQGIGKSFVVDRLIEKLNDKENDIKNYFVIKYDCWKNDFYEEPIKAILIEIYNTIEENKDNYDEEFKIILSEISKDILNLIDKYLESKYKLLHSIIHYIFEKKKKLDEAKEKMISQIDDNENLKILLKKVRDNLCKIANQKTIIVFVDELDRCLPNYQIKVLERLHHIFNNLKNVQVICIYDKSLIDKTIKNIFGEQTSIDRYMKKFINFNLKLSNGIYGNSIFELFPVFFGRIKNHDIDEKFILEIISAANLEIRDIIKMIENLIQINRICLINEKEFYTAFVHFEIVVYLIKIMINKYEKDQVGTFRIHTTKEYIEKIVNNKKDDIGTFYYNKDYVSICQKIFNNLDESDDNNGYVCILYNYQQNNLLDCKALIASVYGIREHFYTPRISIKQIDKAKEILRYIDLFYSAV